MPLAARRHVQGVQAQAAALKRTPEAGPLGEGLLSIGRSPVRRLQVAEA